MAQWDEGAGHFRCTDAGELRDEAALMASVIVEGKRKGHSGRCHCCANGQGLLQARIALSSI